MSDDQASACLIDSNIWLYAFMEGDDPFKSDAARKLIQETKSIVSTQVINEVCVNLLRRANFTEEQISQLIDGYYDKYQVIELSRSVLLTASSLRRSYSLSFWDSLIVATALEAGISTVYSEDMQDELLVEGRLQVCNPFAQGEFAR